MTPKLAAYRDDGPLARLLGAVAGGAVTLPPAALIVNMPTCPAQVMLPGDAAAAVEVEQKPVQATAPVESRMRS